MSDEWFHDRGQGRRGRRSALTILVLVLLIANMGLMAFFWLDFNLKVSKINRDIEGFKRDIEALQFQLSNADFEISSLRDEIRMLGRGNASQSLRLTQIYNQTRMSVVLISIQTGFGGAQGSGFVYDMEGRIITNNHVVEDAAEITVTFIDGTIVPATLVGRDPYVDLAVIDVDVEEDLLRPLKLGNSSELLVGEPVVAIGNPFGLADSMTLGIISAVGRQMEAPGRYAIVDVIQTDAAINPGNSGGPLLNMRGEVVGMNTAIVSETRQFSGIGFAVPSDTIKRELPSLIETGSYQHPYLGITGMDVTPAIAELMGLDRDTRGALVVEVVKGGPAQRAGLKGGTREELVEGRWIRIGGDVIIGVDGRTIRSRYDLDFYLQRYHRPGDAVELTLIRGGRIMELQVTLGARPPPE
ncbi:MAG: S1C family serine protease [Candidatus Bathyarchaeia archaeon]